MAGDTVTIAYTIGADGPEGPWDNCANCAFELRDVWEDPCCDCCPTNDGTPWSEWKPQTA